METKITASLQSKLIRLFQMACSDDNFDIPEMKQLYLFAEDRGVDNNVIHKILIDPQARLPIPETKEERIEYLYDLCLLIQADGKITSDEYNTLLKFCKRFEFEDNNIEPICNYLLECANQNLTVYQVLSKINE